ncbi:MAG: DUF1552 domain-containing protein [Polyangiaceae bacterium]|nr:DUF1552 domain-containing protein [Polyangiaceae bacterium]
MSKALIKRRSLLKGLGGASFLAAPVFRATLAEAQAAPLRFIVLYFPGGAMMTNGTEGMWTYDKMLAPLAPLSSDILLFNNIIDAALPDGSDPGHGGERTMLTGDGRGMMEEGGFIPQGMASIDQAIAQSVGANTRFSSLQFGVYSDTADCNGRHTGAITYSNGAVLPPVMDPATMFTRLFGNAPVGPAPTDPAATAKLQALNAQRQSILDLLKGQVTSIQGLVGSAEKLRLDEHLNTLRELEKQIMNAPGGTGGGVVSAPGASCGAPTLGSGTDVPAVTAAMNELLYQSINCDATRVATMQMFNTGAELLFSWIGLNNLGHHPMQHSPGPDFVAAQNWLLAQLAVVVKRLKDTPEGGGSMLDNCLVLLTSEMGDGSIHLNRPVPVLLAGKAGGQLRTGRTFNANGRARSDLLLNLANLMGVPLTTFGDPASITGPLNLG